MKNLLIRCNLCGNTEHKILEEQYHPYKVLRCKNCGLVFIFPVPATVPEHYNSEYFKPWTLPKVRRQREKFFKIRWGKVKKLRPQKGKILDIGCGCGEFLHFAKQDGWDVYGTEISPFVVEYVLKTYRINVTLAEDISKISFPEKFFDVVTMWHVLEHLPCPYETLLEVSRILKTGGLLVLAVPNFNNHIEKILYRLVKGKNMGIFHPQERELHLYLFTLSTIKKFLYKTNFKVIKETVDLGQPQLIFKMLNFIPLVIFNLTRLNIGSAIEIFAVKK